MYKLVNAPYERGMTFITNEKNILKGSYLDDTNVLLTNVDKTIFEDFILQREEDGEYHDFGSYLDYLEIDYMILPTEEYVSEENINDWVKEYKYCSYDNSFYDSYSPFGDCVEYFEYYNGHNWKQIEVDFYDDVEKIDSDISYPDNKYGQYDLYKSLYNDTLYLNYSSRFIEHLDHAEEVTEEELKEKFNYELSNSMQS